MKEFENDLVIIAWKIYRETAINRGWLLSLLDSIIERISKFTKTLDKASRIFGFYKTSDYLKIVEQLVCLELKYA